MIPGATNPTHTATQNGNYRVVVTSLGGCTDTSDVFAVSGIVGINDASARLNGIHVYPNPAIDQLYIKAAEAVSVRVYSIEGRELMDVPAAKVIDITTLTGGVYMLRFFDNKGNYIGTKRFTKLSQ